MAPDLGCVPPPGPMTYLLSREPYGAVWPVLTLGQLALPHDEALSVGLVRICENPVVIAAAADQLGSRCPPLVCAGLHGPCFMLVL